MRDSHLSRRDLLKSTVPAAAALAASASVVPAAEAAKPIDIGSHLGLLIDEHLIERFTALEMSPFSRNGPAFTPSDRSREGCVWRRNLTA